MFSKWANPATIPTVIPTSTQYLVPNQESKYIPPTAGKTIINPTVVILETHSMARAMGFRTGEGGT